MVEKQKGTINPKSNDDKCYEYSITAALNLEQIKSHPERISNIKPFINQYNWKEINFLANFKDWKSFESNNSFNDY